MATIARIDQAVIRECFREMHGEFGFATQAAAGAGLFASVGKHAKFGADAATKYAKGQTTGNLGALSEAALDILAANYDAVARHYEAKDVELRDYILSIIRKHKGIDRRHNLDIVLSNLRHSQKKGTRVFATSVYQIFRRYKPTPYERTINPDQYAIPDSHPVICELIYADADTMECSLVTAQGNIYHGALYINREDMLFGIVQRPTKEDAGIHQRFFALHLETRLPMYSSLMMKTGDTSRRPVAAECLYVQVPPAEAEHSDLYKDMTGIVAKAWQERQIDPTSVIWDYLSPLPPNRPPEHGDWARVKYVRDFPALALMATERGRGKALFREPLRTLAPDTIVGLCKQVELRVFRHSTFKSAGTERAA